MKLIRNVIIGVLIIALLAFTAAFVLNAYNTGVIGNKAEKVADTFTEDIIGKWYGEHSISQIEFKEDGSVSLTLLGVVLNGQYSDSYDLETQKHTLKVKYSGSFGISVERYFIAELVEDKLSLVDTQFDSVKMIYSSGDGLYTESDASEKNKTTVYNPGIKTFSQDIIGEWVSNEIPNSGYEFKDNSAVFLKIYGVGYDGTYSVSIHPPTNRCVLKINYISVAGVTVSNSYYVTIEDDLLTLTQKNYENINAVYKRVNN